jgi:ketosteroid isomerase-like protein
MDPPNAEAAQTFAAQWLDAWNRHDIEAILSHYADEIVFLSPLAQQRVGNGQVIGIEALRDYWSIGVVTICYRNHRGQSVAETFEFQESGKVKRGYACYS